MSLIDAAFNVVHDYPGGAMSLGPRVGKSTTTLSAEVAGSGSAKFGLVDALKVTQLTGDLRILQAFALACGQMLVPLPNDYVVSDDASTLALLARMSKEFGDVVVQVAVNLNDGVVTDNGLRKVVREAGELIAVVHAVCVSMQARNASGCLS